MEPVSKEHFRTLYVSRPLLNAWRVRDWALAAGVPNLISPDSMHVTIMYSRVAVDWDKVDADFAQYVEAMGGPRYVKRMGPAQNVIALRFASDSLNWRHNDLREMGAAWDWPEYLPHVTLSYEVPADFDADSIEPYDDVLMFGPERFREVNDNAMKVGDWAVMWTERAAPSVVTAKSSDDAKARAMAIAESSYGEVADAIFLR